MASTVQKKPRKLTYADALVVGSVVALGIFTLLPAEQPTDSTAILLPSADETRCNGIVDYNYTNIVGYHDSYSIDLASIPNGATITAVEITPCASRNKTGSGNITGSATMDLFYRYNGVKSADRGSYELTGTTPMELSATTFAALSLVKGPLSTLEIGAVFSAGDRGVRLGRMAAVLTCTPLVPPLNLVANNVAVSQNDLPWRDVSSTKDGFKVERSFNSQFDSPFYLATTSADTVSYKNTGLITDETYYYRVRAFNSGGASSYSNIAHAITATVVPQTPLNLVASASSSGIMLNWAQTSRNEEGFTVDRWVSGANFTEIGKTGIDETTYTDHNLSKGAYYYRVRAFNRIGNSGYSNTVSVTIP